MRPLQMHTGRWPKPNASVMHIHTEEQFLIVYYLRGMKSLVCATQLIFPGAISPSPPSQVVALLAKGFYTSALHAAAKCEALQPQIAPAASCRRLLLS